MIKSFISEREKHRYYNSLSEEQKYDAFNDILFESEHVVFLGGAGVSTESGIPDFRSKNGLYKKRVKAFGRYKPEYLLSSECLRTRPELFFDYYRQNMDARNAEPNAAHFKLAEMEKSGRLEGVITQNIDGLHQKAGSRNVQEIHGTIWTNHCVSCHEQYDVNFVFDSADAVPRCPKCGNVPVPEDQLPLVLPELDDYKPSGGASPLEKATDWVNVEVDGKKGKRETSTMPGSAGSSWYFLRYIDPHKARRIWCSMTA